MKLSKFEQEMLSNRKDKEQQIADDIRAGLSAKVVCLKHGICANTFYRRKAKIMKKVV